MNGMKNDNLPIVVYPSAVNISKVEGIIQFFPLSQLLVLYTDGSKSDSSETGSGVYAAYEEGLDFVADFTALTAVLFTTRSLLESKRTKFYPPFLN
ncbi:hypothetical protein TNCT_601581 [Trichonephila clavata]|uniref:Uncharacterized protein n=1 Tax=Trichonephila clavata TaxID=2740835 RepID=A0A8X6JCN5_TRICU|nr:hypothetical protein TNCT_601581 [Trichonephila clavata]